MQETAMPAPIIAAIASALIPSLARKGLDLVAGVMNGAADSGVEKITKMIEEKTGITVDQIADDKLTEAQWVDLKSFELEHQELLLKELEGTLRADIDRMRLTNEDRADARALQAAALGGPDWLARNFVYAYAIAVTLLTFAFVGFASFMPGLYETARNAAGEELGYLSGASQARARVIDTVLGFLLGVTLSAIIQFFFGSSAGATAKDGAIDRLLARDGKDR
jgi:hypothetical protein